MARKVRKSTAPIYLVGAFWLLWAALLPLYKPVHFLLLVLASLVVWYAGRAIWPNGGVYEEPAPRQDAPRQDAPRQDAPRQDAPAPKQAPPAEPAQPPEVEALIAERDRAVAEIRRLNDSIKDPILSLQIDRLESLAKKIMGHVVQNPSQLPQIRRFLNYYLPTTLKLLNAYDRMASTEIDGANISGTKGKIEDMMDAILLAFEKQLDALFGDEALDISADIAVLEQMLAQEGIGGDGGFKI